MATIPEYPEATTLDDSDLFLIRNGGLSGTDKKVLTSTLKSEIKSDLKSEIKSELPVIGSIYIQYPGESSPSTLMGGTWQNVNIQKYLGSYIVEESAVGANPSWKKWSDGELIVEGNTTVTFTGTNAKTKQINLPTGVAFIKVDNCYSANTYVKGIEAGRICS